MPFSLNPFSKIKPDFSKIPEAPKELPAKRKYFGEEDDRTLQGQQDSQKGVTEKTIIKEVERPEPDGPMV